jgi:hypothetical protein
MCIKLEGKVKRSHNLKRDSNKHIRIDKQQPKISELREVITQTIFHDTLYAI